MKALVYHGPGKYRLDEIMKAYDTFGNASKEKALKVVLTG